jgi:transcriptional regulator with XRE-family HTH domain
MQTTLTGLIKERGQTYASIAHRTGLQARTVRMIATGETPMDRVSVGTVRQIAAALGVTTAELIEPAVPRPGDPMVFRSDRLAHAIREVMWGAGMPAAYPSPVESSVESPDDSLAGVEPADFFSATQTIDADRG